MLALAVHPIIDVVAVADVAGEVRVMAIGHEEETVLSGFPDRVSMAIWGAAGRIPAAEGVDEVTAWGIDSVGEPSARPVHLVRHPGAVRAMASTPVAELIASGDETGTVLVWDAPTGDVVATIHADAPVTRITWSPIGLGLAVGTANGAVGLTELR